MLSMEERKNNTIKIINILGEGIKDMEFDDFIVAFCDMVLSTFDGALQLNLDKEEYSKFNDLIKKQCAEIVNVLNKDTYKDMNIAGDILSLLLVLQKLILITEQENPDS